MLWQLILGTLVPLLRPQAFLSQFATNLKPRAHKLVISQITLKTHSNRNSLANCGICCQ